MSDAPVLKMPLLTMFKISPSSKTLRLACRPRLTNLNSIEWMAPARADGSRTEVS
jgi:hypothetical protein